MIKERGKWVLGGIASYCHTSSVSTKSRTSEIIAGSGEEPTQPANNKKVIYMKQLEVAHMKFLTRSYAISESFLELHRLLCTAFVATSTQFYLQCSYFSSLLRKQPVNTFEVKRTNRGLGQKYLMSPFWC